MKVEVIEKWQAIKEWNRCQWDSDSSQPMKNSWVTIWGSKWKAMTPKSMSSLKLMCASGSLRIYLVCTALSYWPKCQKFNFNFFKTVFSYFNSKNELVCNLFCSCSWSIVSFHTLFYSILSNHSLKLRVFAWSVSNRDVEKERKRRKKKGCFCNEGSCFVSWLCRVLSDQVRWSRMVLL